MDNLFCTEDIGMRTPLEKARRDPESTKARILNVARKIFGEYGYHGGTPRMIAEEVGIDLSTIHYHWGEKKTFTRRLSSTSTTIWDRCSETWKKRPRMSTGRAHEDRL